MNLLGIHDGHNAAVAFLRDGEVVFAIQEERLSRVKNQGGPPALAVNEVLEKCDLPVEQLDLVALNGQYMTYDHWSQKELLEAYERSGESSGRVREMLKSVPGVDGLYRRQKQAERHETLAALHLPKERLRAVEHHVAHAAAAYYGWGCRDEAVLVLTCDGSGDRLCATISVGKAGRLKRLVEVDESQSIGRLYAIVTYLLGMAPLEHEYKVMGLAPYAGDAPQVDRLARKFAALFEWDPEQPLRWRRADNVPSMYAATHFIAQLIARERFDWVAAGVQAFLESFMAEWIKRAIQETGISRLALAGGVFMNVKLNKVLLELPEVEELFVFPSCGDETNAIGAAYHLQAQANLEAQQMPGIAPLTAVYWGQDITDSEVEAALKDFQFSCPIQVEVPQDIEATVARVLAKGEIVARAKGRMEFGARSLGNRSILARADDRDVVHTINSMIKMRDFWMPFAPSILSERMDDYVIRVKPMVAPYMIIAFDTQPGAKDKCIAAIHPYDHTCRPQEVISTWNPDYYRLISSYQEITGEGIILNTSFNLHGYPIVCSPLDALRVFDNSGLTRLALGSVLITKR